MASAADFSSVLRENDVKVLYVEFNIPKEMSWRDLGEDDKAISPPEGYITVYEAHLRSGLCLPLPKELESIVAALRVPIAQLHANTVRYLCTLCIFARKLSAPSAAESSSYAWLTKAIRLNPDEFKRDFLVSSAETKKVGWGPPSPVQKPHPPIMMMRREDSMGVIIRPRPSEEATERVTGTPSSSSSQIDLVAVGIYGGPGSSSGVGESVEDRPVEAGGVILAQPAARAVPGAAWMESAEEPARDVPEGSRVYIVEPSTRADSPAAAPSAARRRKPVAVAPEAAREELSEEPAAVVDDDEFFDHILDEAAVCSAREDALGSPFPGSPPAGTRLEPRPKRPVRKTYEPRRLVSAVSRKMEQRNRIIADREAKIAWLEAKLAASGGEFREQTAALEAVVAGVEAENAELKAEVARLKEEGDRLKASNKRLADRAAAAENELATRMSPHEIGGALHARLLEGLNIGRRVARLIVPDFPVEFINQRNCAAQRNEDLEGEPRDSQGGPPPL